MYEHQVRPDFSLLHEIRYTQAFLKTVKQNLSHQAKYNQGFGYTKKAIRLALKIGCEDELNNMCKGALRKRIKSVLEGNQKQKSSRTASTHQSHSTSGINSTEVTTMAESSSSNIEESDLIPEEEGDDKESVDNISAFWNIMI
ncbi:12173_t:CDS:2 [Funneliformis mosseae]|uniref:12173_t:CDS:1 n=1 Tax=Funneliformis mosseae TaxID=27381 RepID=A0A9N9DRV2_FUNMO|nr:12173_t:CDS:2 [Funneliformis mosseae]